MPNHTGGVIVLFPFLLFFVIAAGFGIWQARSDRRKSTQHLGELAKRLGLGLQPASGARQPSRVQGTMRGKAIEIYTYTTSSGESEVTWAAVSVRPAASGGLTFTLKRRGLGARLAELFGRHRIKSGHPAFDLNWSATSNQPEFFGAALLPELCAKLEAARVAGARGTFGLRAGVVRYAETGNFADAKRTARFDALTDILCDLADIAEVAAARANAP